MVGAKAGEIEPRKFRARVGDRRPDLYRLSRALPGRARDLIRPHMHSCFSCLPPPWILSALIVWARIASVFYLQSTFLCFFISRFSLSSLRRPSLCLMSPAPVRTPLPLLSIIVFQEFKLYIQDLSYKYQSTSHYSYPGYSCIHRRSTESDNPHRSLFLHTKVISATPASISNPRSNLANSSC